MMKPLHNLLLVGALVFSATSIQGIEIGDPCPDFSMKGSDGRTYSLSDMKGKAPFVIAWFPKAFTGGCTKECKSFRSEGEKIRHFDALYFTASTDTVDLNTKFAQSLDLDYPILSDPGKKVAEAFGVVDEFRPVPRRWTFYVNKNGKIVDIDKKINVSNAGVDVADKLASLKVAKNATVDNTISRSQKAAGWQLLFNGKDDSGWMTSKKTKIQTKIEDGSLVPFKSGGYLIVHKQQFENFEFSADVKMSSDKCNSGIFFRVSNLDKPVQNGFEAQVLGSKGNGYHHFGAIYDLAKTSIGDFQFDGWNRILIRAVGPHIDVFVNGHKVSSVNTDDFPEKGKRPDGTKHKFGVVKDLPKSGYLGFQDHGHKVWYKNVKARVIQ